MYPLGMRRKMFPSPDKKQLHLETFQNRIIATTDWYLIESMDKTFQYYLRKFATVILLDTHIVLCHNVH